MGSRFKKPESVRRGKFAKVLLFGVLCGWGEVADTSWKGYPLRPSPGSRGVRGKRRKMLGPRALESQPLRGGGQPRGPLRAGGHFNTDYPGMERAGQGGVTPRSASGRLAIRGPRLAACHACPGGPWKGCFRGPEEALLPPGPAACSQPPSPAGAVGTWILLLWVEFLGLEFVSLRLPMSAL